MFYRGYAARRGEYEEFSSKKISVPGKTYMEYFWLAQAPVKHTENTFDLSCYLSDVMHCKKYTL